jgi:glutamate/tyrosine decarboxylase-like PLP-dependent enzyme
MDQTQLIKDIHDRIIHYLENQNKNIGLTKPEVSKEYLEKEFDFNLDTSTNFDGIKEIIEKYLTLSVKTGSTNFYNQLFSGFSVTGYLGEILTAVTNSSMYTFEMSPVATLMEKELIKRMCSLIGYHNGFGTFVTGGSNGNLLGMLAAIYQFDPTLKENGVFGSKVLTGFISEESHYSFLKAAHQLGIGTKQIIKVPCDNNGRMEPSALENSIQKSINNGNQPFFVGGTAGSTIQGSFDPFSTLADICEKYNLWFHVDASWGGSAIISSKHNHLMKGIERSNSLTWCAHKMMGMPLMCTTTLFKDSSILKKINTVEGTDYLFHDDTNDNINLGEHSLQCGRRTDALKLWLSWKYLGDKGFEKNIDHIFDMALYAKEKIESSTLLKLINTVESLNVCFQIQPNSLESSDWNQFNIFVREKLLSEGKLMVNYANINSTTCIRLVTSNFKLKQKDLDYFFFELEKTANDLLTN